ncbi:hypothetical protein NEOLI_004737 [Neolecta irregularis DAH-3]|uniref:NADH-ubiquinone oxidoreductase 14 kDa subunit n=1 Tax=Neolecta irregularis (strain DAH-3) TaxID=1198029 RepID=A0A1U7LHF0_NEOID|nr:hypothetical protein NEOLI_004737 [Neolecta irregularis DAH-3]|eukprot:OLL22023.1 hypothetical protein NEOLI_004737 [Neolecta irregularis DAH-3]
MPMKENLIGWAAFGLAVRFYQLGLQKLPLFNNPSGHVLSMVGCAAVGGWLYTIEVKQLDAMRDRRDILLANRFRRAQEDQERERILRQVMKKVS